MDNLTIVSEDVIKELLAAKIKTYCDSDEGEIFIADTLKEETEKYFTDSGYWHNVFLKVFRNFLKTKSKELLSTKNVEDLSFTIIELGMKTWLKGLGYKVIKINKERS